jgi:hypothetical protein
METVLGRGYSINDESGLTDFYSPPSSIVDEDDDLFYPEEENDNEIELNNNTNLSSSSIDEINSSKLNKYFSIQTNFFTIEDDFKSLPLKLMSIESTPPPTPLVPRHLFDSINNTTMSFQNMTIKTPSKPTEWSFNPSTPKPTTNLLTPTSVDRYLIEQCRLSDSMYKSSTSKAL